MMFRFTLFLTFFFAGSLPLCAQDIRFCYQPQFDSLLQRDTLDVYMHSTTADSVGMRAVNFSFTFHDSCTTFDSLQSFFSDPWGMFLEGIKVDTQLLSYQNQTYNRRLQYGNSDPAFPLESIIWAPPLGDSIRVLRIFLSGSCSDNVYMENQQENSINQIGDTTFTPIPFFVESCIPPDTMSKDSMNMSIRDLQVAGIRVFPNPTPKRLYIYFSQAPRHPPVFSLYDVLGKKIEVPPGTQVSATKEHELDIAFLPQGLYLLQVNVAGKKLASLRFLKSD